MRLLLVEDDPKLALAVSRGLRAEGYAVDVAGDGEEALRHAGVSDYDVVVLDVMLPGRDGFAVCRSLRARGSWVPILMLTARGGASMTESPDRTPAPTTTSRSRSISASCSPGCERW